MQQPVGYTQYRSVECDQSDPLATIQTPPGGGLDTHKQLQIHINVHMWRKYYLNRDWSALIITWYLYNFCVCIQTTYTCVFQRGPWWVTHLCIRPLPDWHIASHAAENEPPPCWHIGPPPHAHYPGNTGVHHQPENLQMINRTCVKGMDRCCFLDWKPTVMIGRQHETGSQNGYFFFVHLETYKW